MNKKDITIGVTTVAFSKNQVLTDRLKEEGFGKIKTNVAGIRFDRSELVYFLKECDGAIVGLDKIDHALLSQLPRLKVISKYGVGLDNIDMEASKIANVSVLHTAGVNKRSVAEMALGFMLSLSRNLYVTSNLLKGGTWFKNGGTQLTGKTVGIIGVGNIGRDLVHLLQPFDCRILLNDIINIDDFCLANKCVSSSKQQIYEESDIISIHTPLNDSTYNLFNKEVFAEMKPSCFIINTARGEILNLADLKSALLEKQIAGAALDVYHEEPPVDMELISIPNLINTPHIGGNAKEAVEAMGQAAIDNLINYYSNGNYRRA